MSDILRSDQFELELFDGFQGIKSYRSIDGKAQLLGGSPESALTVVVLDPLTGHRVPCRLELKLKGVKSDSRTHLVCAMVEDRCAAVLSLTISLQGCIVSIASEFVEPESFNVASVFMELFRVEGNEQGAALILPTRSGRLVDVATAKAEKGVHKVDWFEPAPIAMAGHDSMLGVLTLDTIDSQIVHEIRDDPKSGSITVQLLHRHESEKPESIFLAQSIASCKVRLVAAIGEAKVDWTAGAALVRDEIESNLSDLYVGSLIYKVILQIAGVDDAMTYADVLALIRRVNWLTGGVRQIVYLVGWQHGGHDTGYPDVYTANPRVGSFEDFRTLKEAAKAENAIVSLHDNYHDTYMDSPAWDPSIVCIDRDGELRKGGIWGGGRQAYEIGPTKYAPICRPRAEWTVRTLGLEQTTHLDVLSDKPDMVDYDVKHPASREQNIRAKRRIIEMYRKFGVDVTSEVLTSPFVPFMHHFWHVERRPIEGWGPHERIPLIPFLYHGKVTAGGDASTDAGKLDQIEYGWTFSADWSKTTEDAEIMDQHYLVGIPWSLLAKREIVGFAVDGDWEKVSYSPDTYVRVNRVTPSYEIVIDGVVIAEDFSTFAQVGDSDWVVYSREGREVSIRTNQDYKIVPLIAAPGPVASWNGTLTFDAVARTPYRISSEA